MCTINESITVREVLEFVKDNDVRFIKLVFCDLFGRQKNVSITPNKLEVAFSEGISFDGSSINGFSDVTQSDLFLVPDPTTMAVLPWRPQQGRVIRFYCNIRYEDGTPFECDSRYILKKASDKIMSMGYSCKIGTECEFYLFKTDSEGHPTDIPFDNGSYMDVAPLDRGENVRREICFCLEDLGLQLEASHHEQGPGQNEIDFKFSDVIESADNLLAFKTAVKAISAQNGLFASFMPKPIENKSGNGMHINISLSKNGNNIFQNEKFGHNTISDNFIAGILSKTKEITLFLNPIANSYERFGKCEAPSYVCWSKGNRSPLIRIPAGSGERVRMELRSPDPSANPYIAFALIVSAGIYGIENSLKLPAAVDKNLYLLSDEEKTNLEKLPSDMNEALELAKNSEFAKEVLGERAFDNYISYKTKELNAVSDSMNKQDFYRTNYFEVI